MVLVKIIRIPPGFRKKFGVKHFCCLLSLLMAPFPFQPFVVVFFLLVQYVLHLYDYFKEWHKNPQWSFSCCLALILPLNDLQGEIHGMAGTNIIETQLHTGEFECELTTVGSSVMNSGVIDFTLEEAEKSGEDSVEMQNNNRHGGKCSNKKCHQGTQTEFSLLFAVTDVKKMSAEACPVDSKFLNHCKLHEFWIHGMKNFAKR